MPQVISFEKRSQKVVSLVYIGQTRRNLQSRLHEHNPATTVVPTSNQMSPSISENPYCITDFNDLEVLCSFYNTKELLSKETLLIQQ